MVSLQYNIDKQLANNNIITTVLCGGKFTFTFNAKSSIHSQIKLKLIYLQQTFFKLNINLILFYQCIRPTIHNTIHWLWVSEWVREFRFSFDFLPIHYHSFRWFMHNKKQQIAQQRLPSDTYLIHKHILQVYPYSRT